MSTDPRLLCSYPRARDACNQLMKYFMGIQPSNPCLEESREAWQKISELLDDSNEWERLNPGHDKETQLEISKRNYWIKRAEKGIFTEEQDHAAIDQELEELNGRAEIRKQWLEGLLPQDRQDEDN